MAGYHFNVLNEDTGRLLLKFIVAGYHSNVLNEDTGRLTLKIIGAGYHSYVLTEDPAGSHWYISLPAINLMFLTKIPRNQKVVYKTIASEDSD